MCTGCISVFFYAILTNSFLVPRTRSFMLYLNLLTCLLDFRKIRIRTLSIGSGSKKPKNIRITGQTEGGHFCTVSYTSFLPQLVFPQ